MRKIVKKKILYRCSICNTDYEHKSDAERCELRILEKKTLSVGDKVSSISPRSCFLGQSSTFEGKIVEIIGPMAADFKYYKVKWLGGKRTNYHVFEFQVKFKCSHCKKIKEVRYYAPELKKISR